jgi:sialic acid synthase SpsE/mannose-6-phosphate isomerase-like protein (cupin superfamily)
MEKDFDFNDLFVLDMANNHQGSLEHGLRIIREFVPVIHENHVRAGIKFQFRQLDTFIHPSHRKGSNNKHIQRFLGTRLARKDFSTMAEEVRKNGLVTIATPFDEESVDMLVELGIEVLKIGSVSVIDWPLLESAADSGKPVICSTAGTTLDQIADLVSFFEHRRVNFALMHCVSIYPTPDDRLQLNQIDLLRNRYPHIAIGFSTHERPEDLAPIQIAVAKGARIFERHVGIATDKIKLNDYSSTPEQIDAWFKAYKQARLICGDILRPSSSEEELTSLDSLRRAIYARRPLKEGAKIERADVYFAMPFSPGQLHPGQWKSGIIARKSFDRDEPISINGLNIPQEPDKQVIFDAIHQAKAMLNEARITLPTDFKVEFSHHYGIPNFSKVGAIFIECINRSYCKKLILQLRGQLHPNHYHKRKEETFQVLHGILEMEVEGRRRTLYPGDIQVVQQGVWHKFWTNNGVIFEEVSTTHFNDDSFYEDKEINKLPLSQRKKIVDHWGRYQI